MPCKNSSRTPAVSSVERNGNLLEHEYGTCDVAKRSYEMRTWLHRPKMLRDRCRDNPQRPSRAKAFNRQATWLIKVADKERDPR